MSTTKSLCWNLQISTSLLVQEVRADHVFFKFYRDPISPEPFRGLCVDKTETKWGLYYNTNCRLAQQSVLKLLSQHQRYGYIQVWDYNQQDKQWQESRQRVQALHQPQGWRRQGYIFSCYISSFMWTSCCCYCYCRCKYLQKKKKSKCQHDGKCKHFKNVNVKLASKDTNRGAVGIRVRILYYFLRNLY